MRPGTDPVLSVIVVGWNVRDFVVPCLHAVYAQAGEVPLEVLYVDNGSCDGTVDAVRARFSQTIVIENRENLGFPRANNQALARARGRYVLFLNSDTVVGAGTLAACVAELERDRTVGMVGCRLMYPDGRVQYEGGRNPYLLRHLLAETFYLHMLFPRHPVFAHQLMGGWDHMDTRDVEAISGAFMMVRRSVAEALGGLPDEILMYHEDLAFCLRVRRQGWRIRYLGEVTTTHFTNQTTSRQNLRWYLLEGEAKLRLIREAQGAICAVLARAVFALRSLLRLGIALAGAVLPGLKRLKRRYPKVFHLERHGLQLAWSFWPGLVRPLVPAPPEAAEHPAAR